MSNKPFTGVVQIPKYILKDPTEGPSMNDAEWASRNKYLLFLARTASDGNSATVTVPKGKKWFITNATLIGGIIPSAPANVTNPVQLTRSDYASVASNGNCILRVRPGQTTASTSSSVQISSTYPCPMVLPENTSITMTTGQYTEGHFVLTGWEENIAS